MTSAHSYDRHGDLWRLRYERSGTLLFEQTLTRDSLGCRWTLGRIVG